MSRARIIALTCMLSCFFGEIASAETVYIVKSKRLQAYEAPAQHLAARLMPMKSVTLSLSTGDKELDRIAAAQPSLLVALGSRALDRLVRRFDKVPILYAMVLNPAAIVPAGRTNVAGIALEVPFEAVMTQLLMTRPSIRRLGVIYHPGTSRDRVEAARKQAGRLMLEIIDIRVNSSTEVVSRLDKAKDRIDALWMVPDAVAYTTASYRAVVERTWKHRIPFCAFSRAFVESGALLSIGPNNAAVGEQLALLTQRILQDGVPPEQLGQVPPIGTELVINQGVAKRIGMTIDPDVIDSADEVIE